MLKSCLGGGGTFPLLPSYILKTTVYMYVASSLITCRLECSFEQNKCKIVPFIESQNDESRNSQNRGPGIARNSAARSKEMSQIAVKQNRGQSIQNRHLNRILV